MKKLALIFVIGALVSFMPMRAQTLFWFERGDLTLYGRRQICL
ncbi:Uncharacterised protein [Escherichia coli]|uniref:Uncharacterized protein n=1 Tax=Escherichia coli TaxID=562 RepID=A0A3S4K0X8_ECOLX|nr:Uncharacterised protein [Escherichia coli]